MIRTQISLTKDEYVRAKKEAKRLGLSLAAFLRESLKNIMSNSSEKPWMKYQGMVASGATHTPEEIDDIAYGTKD